MTKTKRQLRAEAVERLRELNAYVDGPESIVDKLAYGLDTDRLNYHVEIEHIIDLLTDDCGPCYSCAKLAELVAENSQLRAKVDELEADESQAVEDTAERVTNKGEMLYDSSEKLGSDLGSGSQVCSEVDSREKLEADCEKLIGNIQKRVFSGRDAGALRCQLKELLDRQAAITKGEWCTERGWWDSAEECKRATALCYEKDEQIAELQAKVVELTEQLESAHAKNRSFKAHIAKMQAGRHGWHVKGEKLQCEVDRLTRENVSLARDLGECMAERDELKRENARLSSDEFYLRCTLVDMNGEVAG